MQMYYISNLPRIFSAASFGCTVMTSIRIPPQNIMYVLYNRDLFFRIRINFKANLEVIVNHTGFIFCLNLLSAKII